MDLEQCCQRNNVSIGNTDHVHHYQQTPRFQEITTFLTRPTFILVLKFLKLVHRESNSFSIIRKCTIVRFSRDSWNLMGFGIKRVVARCNAKVSMYVQAFYYLISDMKLYMQLMYVVKTKTFWSFPVTFEAESSFSFSGKVLWSLVIVYVLYELLYVIGI